MSPLMPMTTIGTGSNWGARLFFLSCLHKTVSPTFILIAAVCLLLSAYLFIFSFCSLSRLRTVVSSECSGCPRFWELSTQFPPEHKLIQATIAPVVLCTVALYALIPLCTSSRRGLPCNVAILAVFFILCIHLSTSTLASGHPGITFRCLNPSSCVYSSNLWLLSGGPLSDFTTSGTSVGIEYPLNTGIVAFSLVDPTNSTTGYLEYWKSEVSVGQGTTEVPTDLCPRSLWLLRHFQGFSMYVRCVGLAVNACGYKLVTQRIDSREPNVCP